MFENISTKRLKIGEFSAKHSSFILELLNTEAFIKFIGDRNVRTENDAKIYIEDILKLKTKKYWIILLEEKPIGMLSMVKRDYLEFHDFGFSLLPQYGKQGYAFEAAQAFLNSDYTKLHYSQLYAITVPENNNSIQLLKKLGFEFVKEIENDGQKLNLYFREY